MPVGAFLRELDIPDVLGGMQTCSFGDNSDSAKDALSW